MSFRISKSNFIRYLFLPLIGFVVGYLIGECQLINLFEYSYSANTKIEYTPLEYTNYAVGIFTAFGTLAAVIIALFKESILSVLWHPKFEISLDDEKGFSEELNQDSNPLKANSYKSTIVFENKGNAEATDCELYINEIKVGADNDHLQSYKKHGLGEPLKWGEGTCVDIPEGKTRTFDIIEIMARTSTPATDQTKENSPLILNIIGSKALPYSSNTKTVSIDFCLKHKQSRQENFTVLVEWTGDWCDRKTEMNNCLNVTLKK